MSIPRHDLAILAIILFSNSAQAANFFNLGTLSGHANSVANGVSADGTIVVGTSSNGSANDTPFKWTSADGMSLVPTPGSEAHGMDISADGSAIVGIYASGAPPVGFRWKNNTLNGIGPGLPMSNAVSIFRTNADGTVAVGGICCVPLAAIRWDQTNGTQQLGLLPGHSGSRAHDVSADGTFISGYSTPSGAQGEARAVRWTHPGGPLNLGTLPGWTKSFGGPMSSDGSFVAGHLSNDFGGQGQPSSVFLWSLGSGMTELGGLAGFTENSPLAMSADGGTLAGEAHTGPNMHAFLWKSSLGFVDLNSYLPSLGIDLTNWTLTRVKDMSADGRTLVGEGLFNGQTRAWVATDVPEPATLSMLVLAMLAIFPRRQRAANHSSR